MWQSILLSNNGNILSAVWTQSGESGNTLKNKCSGTSDERANIFPCLQRAKSSAVANVRWVTQCLTLTKQVFRKDDSVERKPTALAHSTATKMPRRYLRGNALGIDRESSRETRLSEPFRSKHQARFFASEALKRWHDSPTAVPQLPKKKPRHRCRQQQLEYIVHNVSRRISVMQQAYRQCLHGGIVASEKAVLCRFLSSYIY